MREMKWTLVAAAVGLWMGCETGRAGGSESADVAGSGADSSAADGADSSAADGNDGADSSAVDGNDSSVADGNDSSAADGNDGADSSVADGNDGADSSAADGNDSSVADGSDGADSSAVDGTDGVEVPKGPAVVETLPADGQAGVREDAGLVITFNVPMDTASVEAAWMSKPLPAESVTFSWDETHTILSVLPNAPLEVAEGSPEDTEATPYWYMIGEEALSASGVPLGADVTVKFTTRRHLFAKVPADPMLSGAVRSDNTTWAKLWVGDSGFSDTTYVASLSFDLPALTDVEPVAATLYFDQTTNEGAPFMTLGKGASLFDAQFEARTWADVGGHAFSEVAVPLMIAVSGIDGANVALDVGEAFAGDLAEGYRRTQFAVGFPVMTDGDGAPDNLELLNPVLSIEVYAP